MKKIILTVLALFLTFGCANAFEFKFFAREEALPPTPVQEIEAFFQDYVRASNSKNIEELKKFYDPKYINTDGFTYENIFEIIEQTWAKFPQIQYEAIVKEIEVDGNKAVAEVSDVSVAQVNSSSENEDRKVKEYGYDGVLHSTSLYIVNLEKKNNQWKIVSEKVIDEETILKYGEATNLDIKLEAPKIIRAGEEYTASLTVQMPEEAFVMGAISTENVVYPPLKTKEKYRRIPPEGILERIVRANKDNTNEYVMATVGITKARFEHSSIQFIISGAAFVVKKVDVIPISDVKGEREQIVKNNKK